MAVQTSRTTASMVHHTKQGTNRQPLPRLLGVSFTHRMVAIFLLGGVNVTWHIWETERTPVGSLGCGHGEAVAACNLQYVVLKVYGCG